jgi:hypothetical protein
MLGNLEHLFPAVFPIRRGYCSPEIRFEQVGDIFILGRIGGESFRFRELVMEVYTNRNIRTRTAPFSGTSGEEKNTEEYKGTY